MAAVCFRTHSVLLKVNHKYILKKQSQLIGYDYILPLKTAVECSPGLKRMRSLCQIVIIIDCYIQPLFVQYKVKHAATHQRNNHCPSHRLHDDKLIFALFLTPSFSFSHPLPRKDFFNINIINKMSSFQSIIAFPSKGVRLFHDLS